MSTPSLSRPDLRPSFLTEAAGLKHSARLLMTMGAARVALLFAFLLLFHRMGPVQFGIFFLGYNTLAMVPLLADFGIGQTFVRHISFYRESEPRFAAYLHRLFFVLKLLSVGALALATLPAVWWAAGFLNLQGKELFLVVAILGSGAAILYDYVNSVFQSSCLFKRYELNLFLRNSLFLAAVMTLVFAKQSLLTPIVVVSILVLINLALAISAYPYVSRQWQNRSGQFDDFRAILLRYSKWLTVAAVCFAFYRRMDVYYLSHFRTLREVGTYSVASVLVEPVAMISPALFTVFLPKLAAEPTPEKFKRHFHLVLLVSLFVALGICAYGAGLYFAFPRLGPEYREAFPVAALLLFGTLLLIAYNMLSLIFLASDHPELFGQIALAMAAFSLLANWFAVPAYGVFGAATVYGSSQMAGIVLATFSIRRLLRRQELFGRVAGTMAAPESALT